MIMEILLTIWLSLALFGIISLIIGGLIDECKIGEVLLWFGRIIVAFWEILSLLFIIGFSIYVVWS